MMNEQLLIGDKMTTRQLNQYRYVTSGRRMQENIQTTISELNNDGYMVTQIIPINHGDDGYGILATDAYAGTLFIPDSLDSKGETK